MRPNFPEALVAPRLIHLLVLGVALLTAYGAAAQPEAQALLAEGNSLMRAGVHRTALLRYREAAAAGLDSPLLHYNLGVAYYRLERYREAAAEFERAAADDRLAALAHYNLGLAQRALGDDVAAEGAFRAAADLSTNRDLRRLAERAADLVSISEPVAARERTASAARRPTDDSRVGEFELRATARLGQDDNIYHAPAEPYVDLADPALPTVTPVVQSASFTPVDLLAAYSLHNEAGDTDFRFAYVLDADFYPSEFANANRISQRFSMGADILLGERERRRRELQSAFFVRQHQETNFDPDTGLEREINGEDISDRFSYQASGVEGEFDHRLGAWRWALDMRFERREYDAMPLVANYDHDYYYTAVSFEREIKSATTLTFGVRRYSRVYDTRPARDLSGDLLPTNPPEEYDYSGVALGIERRLTRTIDLDFDYLRVDRLDTFLGYYDYTEDAVRLRAVFRPHDRFYLSIGGVARAYDYPNAFAFNEPTAGPRELDERGLEALAEFRLGERWSIHAGLDSTDVTSTDARAAYARARTTLGATWRR
jgi:tetratricopeptide (TPR) repeat protein